MRVEESVVIGRPLEEVFAYVADPENLPEWASTVLEIRKHGSGPLQEGQTFASVGKFLGRRLEMVFQVIAHEPPWLHSHRSVDGPIPNEWTLTFEEEQGGTRYTEVVEGEPGRFFKLVGPLLEAAGRRQLRSDLGTLKDLLEAGS